MVLTAEGFCREGGGGGGGRDCGGARWGVGGVEKGGRVSD